MLPLDLLPFFGVIEGFEGFILLGGVCLFELLQRRRQISDNTPIISEMVISDAHTSPFGLGRSYVKYECCRFTALF